jgi:hypothetical protein
MPSLISPATRMPHRARLTSPLAGPLVPDLMARLRDVPTVRALALEFTILTAARPSEIGPSKRPASRSKLPKLRWDTGRAEGRNGSIDRTCSLSGAR